MCLVHGWTETTDVNTARTSLRGCGTTTAALAIGGYNPPPSYQVDITESWNGSAWTEVGDMNTRRSGAGNALSSPYGDTIIFGGYSQPPPNTANAETWNGSAWTEVANLNSAKDNMGGSGDSSTSALCFALFKFATSVHAEPFQVSAFAVFGGGCEYPPKIIVSP